MIILVEASLAGGGLPLDRELVTGIPTGGFGGGSAMVGMVAVGVQTKAGEIIAVGLSVQAVSCIHAAGFAGLFEVVLVGLVTVVVGYGRAERAGARMDDEPEVAVSGSVQLDEVVPSSQGAKAGEGTVHVHHMSAFEGVDGDFGGLGTVKAGLSRRDLLVDIGVQTGEVNFFIGELHRLHAASDIHPHQGGGHTAR